MSALVMHIDMDAFFASIEQQVNPSLKGKPVIIGGRDNKYRSIICAASYEAKALGIDSAMPSWEALKICPQAIFVAADPPKYIYTSREIARLLKDFAPDVEAAAIDEFFMTFEGCDRLLGSLEALARKMKAAIRARFGLNASVGIAPTRTTAKLAAKMGKPDGLVVFADSSSVQSAMKNLPVEKICGVGRRLKERLNLLGISTCGDLARFPDQLLKEHFGVVGLWLKAVCRAEELGDRGYCADRPERLKSVGHSQTLREMTTDEATIKSWIYLLSEMVAARLRRLKLQGRTVHFSLSDGFTGGCSRQKTFIDPTDDGYEITQRCLLILDSWQLQSLSARVLAVSVSHLLPAEEAYLFEDRRRRVRLLQHLDGINQRFGEWTVFPAALKGAAYSA